jgi:hypothetical protein
MDTLPSISNQSQLAQVAQMADEAVRATTFSRYQ